jgi:hypothetical protein
MNAIEEEARRFWSNVNKEGACWIWLGGVGTHGYGFFRFLGVQLLAHQVAFMLSCGEVPDDMKVCHTCDNRICCKPEHLFLGTQADNMRDCTFKGRAGITSKLSSEQVDEIRVLYATGKFFQRTLADEYGVDQATICHIIRNESWRQQL